MLQFQYPILSKVEGMLPETMMLLWSMKEKHIVDSKFRVYFDTLPEAFNTGITITFRLFSLSFVSSLCSAWDLGVHLSDDWFSFL